MSPKVGQCHLPPASEVGVASSLLQGHVHAMSKSWRHSSWNFKVLLASPCIFKVLMRAPCNVKVLAAFFLKLQGFVGIFEILMRSPCIFKVLIGTPCIFNILLASLKSWCLATVLYAFDVWAMLPLKIALWLHECCHDFGEWSDIASLAKIQCWHGLGINGVLTWLHGYWHDFYANEVSTWLHECCHGFDEWSVDVASMVKMQCWHGLGIDAMLAWPWHEWSVDMTKMNVGTASMQMKCCHGFMAKMNVSTTSMQMMVQFQVLMWSVVVASWRR